ncbi:hypothetical protein D3C72_1317150 [compost metagenome]
MAWSALETVSRPTPLTGVICGAPLVMTSSVGRVAKTMAGARAGRLLSAGSIASAFMPAAALVAAFSSAFGTVVMTSHAPPADSERYQ